MPSSVTSRLVTMGKMISEISHDLRKPLTNMKGALQIVRAKHQISDKTRQVLESTEQEIDHLAHLVSELVDFSNPQKYQTKRRPLKPVVDRALRMVENDAQKREITVKVEFPEDLPPIFHDENQILEAFLNIIINALESMEPGGTLTIRAFTDESREFAGKCVGLEFTDTVIEVEAKKVGGATYQMLLTLAGAVAAEEPGFYSNLHMSLPEMKKIEGLFLDKVEEWLKLVKQKDCSGFRNKMEQIKKRLREVDPDYEKYYGLMYRLLADS